MARSSDSDASTPPRPAPPPLPPSGNSDSEMRSSPPTPDSSAPATAPHTKYRSTVLAARERPSRWGSILRASSPRWSHEGPGFSAPPWLFSLALHILVLLVLALCLLPRDNDNRLDLNAVFSDSRGEQMKAEPIDLGEPDEPEPEPVEADEPLPETEEPLVAPEKPAIVDDSAIAGFETVVPNVGSALTGREAGRKESLVRAYGGTAQTEAAVTNGLEWLERHQMPDGRWSLRGPYADGAQNENYTAATAMALLAFQGAGHTHQAGSYRAVVKKGIAALLKMQDADGDFFTGKIGHHRLYSQGQAMIAVCELHGMTRNDTRLAKAAQKSIDYAARIQDRNGGWRYEPGFDSDTSVTGWFMMGLQSGRMAGLNVPETTLQRLSEYIDRAASDDTGHRYGYQPAMDPTYSMTAEALLCRQYLGWQRNDPRLVTGVETLLSRPIDWEDRDVYYWYYATQVLHHFGGEAWQQWNLRLREILPANQTADGDEAGSWSNLGDKWGPHGGRLYVTCMSLYMLEVYYRHLPIYGSTTHLSAPQD